MSTTNERRNKRERERLKDKIHKQFIEKIKGKSDEFVVRELEKIRVRFGLEWNIPQQNILQEDGTPDY